MTTRGSTAASGRGQDFVIAGDQNADPFDGDSADDAILQFLDHPRINASSAPESAGAVEASALQGGANLAHVGPDAQDTADFNDNPAPGNLRADYVLPSATLDILDSAVFWPVQADPLFRLTGVFPFPTSDHRLVWVDVETGQVGLRGLETALARLLDQRRAARRGRVEVPRSSGGSGSRLGRRC